MTSIRPTLLRRAIVLTLLGLGVFAGCQNQPKPVEQPPAVASADRYAALRESIQAAHPGSHVGRVIATHPTRPYVAVGDMPVQDVKVGEIITFVDADGKALTSGTVRDKSSEALFVGYDDSAKRPIQEGDVAVWLKS